MIAVKRRKSPIAGRLVGPARLHRRTRHRSATDELGPGCATILEEHASGADPSSIRAGETLVVVFRITRGWTSRETGLLRVGTGHVAPSSLQIAKHHAQMPQTPPAPPLIQLPLFAETVSLRVRPELNEWRYCRMVGLAQGSAARCWFGIGTAGQRNSTRIPILAPRSTRSPPCSAPSAAATIKTGRHETAPLGGRGLRYAVPIADLAVSR